MDEKEIPAGTDRDGSGLLFVRVQPRASKNRVYGLHDGALKIAVTAPPVEGKANDCIIAYLAKLFKVPKKDLCIKSGSKSKIKTVAFRSIGEKELSLRLKEII